MKERMAWLEQNTVLTFGRCQLERRADLLELGWWRRLAYERAGVPALSHGRRLRDVWCLYYGDPRVSDALSVRAVHAPRVHFQS